MSRNKSIRLQMEDSLRRMFASGKGHSKHLDKQLYDGKPAPDKIYVDTTLRTYRQGCNKFCDFLEIVSVKTRDLEELEPYVQPFIDWMIEQCYSAYTIHTWVSAVCKVLGVSLDAYTLPKRERKDVKRSRQSVKSDAHFAPYKHQDLITFCRCVGPRNTKELQMLRGSDLCEYPDGSYAVHIAKGKGGKERYAPVYGSPAEVELVAELMRKAGDGLVWPHVHSAADIHSYRAEYACRIYKAHARPLDTLTRKEKYYCRKDMAGVVYDRAAMLAASKALGHNRVDVIAQSYLWALEP